MPIIVCHCLYEELKGEEALPTVSNCAPCTMLQQNSGGQNGPWSPFPKKGLDQMKLMPIAYRGEKLLTETSSQAQTARWFEDNQDDLPIMMLMMFSINGYMVETFPNRAERSISRYLSLFTGDYQNLIERLVASGLGGGMTLQEMLKRSLSASKQYIRGTTDVKNIRDNLHYRCEPAAWDELSKMLVEVLEALSKHAEQWTSNNVQDDFRTFIWRSLLVGTQQPRALATVQIAEYLTESYEIEGHTRVTFVSLETASDYVGLWRTCKQELEQFQYEMRLWVLRNQNRPWFVSVAPYTGLQTRDPNRTDGWPDLAYAEYHLVADDAEARKQSLREYAEIASTNVDQFWANFQVLTQAWHRWIEELRDTHDRRNTDMCARAKMLLTDISETPLQPAGYDEWKGWLKDFSSASQSPVKDGCVIVNGKGLKWSRHKLSLPRQHNNNLWQIPEQNLWENLVEQFHQNLKTRVREQFLDPGLVQAGLREQFLLPARTNPRKNFGEKPQQHHHQLINRWSAKVPTQNLWRGSSETRRTWWEKLMLVMLGHRLAVRLLQVRAEPRRM
jgi:hypothetical protein